MNAGQNRSSSTKSCKDGICTKCGCPSGDQVKYRDVLVKRLAEIQRLGKYIDFFETMLTAMKRLNGDELQESEVSDSLDLVDHLKALFRKMDEAAISGLPLTDSSALHRRRRELTETFLHLDKVVKRIECLFARKNVRNLMELLDGSQKNMLGFQVGLKEIQCMEYMERKFIDLTKSNERMMGVAQSTLDDIKALLEEHKKLQRKYDSVCNRLNSLEDLLVKIMKEKYLRKRRNSW